MLHLILILEQDSQQDLFRIIIQFLWSVINMAELNKSLQQIKTTKKLSLMSIWNIFTLQYNEPQLFTKPQRKIDHSDHTSMIGEINGETSRNNHIIIYNDDEIDEVVDPYDSEITLYELQTQVVRHCNKVAEERKRKWSMCSQEQNFLHQCLQFGQKQHKNPIKIDEVNCGGLKIRFNDCKKVHDLL